MSMTRPENFGDIRSAARMRDIITRIVQKVIEEQRPDLRIGKVFSFDPVGQFAQVLFAGSTIEDLVKVRFAKNMVPQSAMEGDFDELGYQALGDLVRVAGKPGSYFIADFYAGGPVPSSAFDGDFHGLKGINLDDPDDPQDAVTLSHLTTALFAKANNVHIHAISEVTNLQSQLNTLFAGVNNLFTPGNWTNLSITSPFTAVGAQQPQYMRDVAGNVWVDGAITRNTGTNGATCFTLPVGFRPSKQVYRQVRTNAAGVPATIEVTTGGVGSFTWAGTPSTLGIECSFPTDG